VDVDEPPGVEPGPTRPPAARRSFEVFYRDEVDRLYRALAVTLGDHHVGREAIDEAMARACARWRTVGGYDSPGGWVYHVALNWARSQWRKVRRELRLESPSDDGPSTAVVVGPEPPGGPALAALGRLPLDQRAVVVCRVLLDLDTAQTAAALRVPEGTAKSRLSRGLAALRREIEGLQEPNEFEEPDEFETFGTRETCDEFEEDGR
jgi:DNA-directed RNA polymerase specialized sigma24 family protein